MKIYLAGPMRGYPKFNFPAFFAAAKKLEADGHLVFNPAAKDVEKHGDDLWKNSKGSLKEAEKKGFSLRDALGMDTAWICEHADAVAMLPGWKKSKGAKAEKALADALGLEVLFLSKSFIKEDKNG